MWNSFQGALEKRVRKQGKTPVAPDKYIITRAAKKVLFDLFGAAGRQQVEITTAEGEMIRLKSTKSIWRSELMVQKESIRQLINKEIGQETIKQVIIERL